MKIVSIETIFDSGPTIANDTGLKASETKKSRLDTRRASRSNPALKQRAPDDHACPVGDNR